MITLAAVVLGAVAAGSVWLLAAWWFPGPQKPREARLTVSQQWARLTRRPAGAAGRRRDIGLLVSVAVGIGAWLATGWILCVLAAPVIWLLLPKLLVAAPHTDLPLLEALDRWIRQLATAIPTGLSVVDAIRMSRRTAPELISGEIDQLVDRINSGVPPRDSLLTFAQDLDSREAEAIVMSLSVAVTSTTGITQILTELSNGLHDRIRALREVETDRAKPRGTARQVTIISIMLLGALAIFGQDYLSPYSTWYGQLLLGALLIAYVASLWQLWRMTIPRRRSRILIRHQDGDTP